MILTDEEIFEAMHYRAGTTTFDRQGKNIAKAQLKKDLDRLEDALENSFVMAYVGEDEPYESTIDPITIREIIDDMRQALLEEVK
jgi:hypothetical protein